MHCAVITAVPLVDRETLKFWVYFSPPRWSSLSDMPIMAGLALHCMHCGPLKRYSHGPEDGNRRGATSCNRWTSFLGVGCVFVGYRGTATGTAVLQ